MSEDPESVPEEVIDRVMSNIEETDREKRKQIREAMVKTAESQGLDKFSLLHGLRGPRNSREENLLEFLLFQGDESERYKIVQDFAERSIDIEMLDEYHAYTSSKLKNLGDFLGAVALAANDCDQSSDLRAGREHERRARDAMEQLSKGSDIYTQELCTCDRFLAELNCTTDRGVVELGSISANSYHELAFRTFRYVSENWKSCSRIAKDSQRGYRYAYAVSASSLFRSNIFDAVPQPQQISAHINDEYLRARLSLPEASDSSDENVDELIAVEIIGPVDSGLYGRVYKGLQQSLDRHVAVKIVKDSAGKSADVLAHARLLSRVQHPCVVTVFSVQKVFIPELEKTVPSIVMEWLEGETFGQRLGKPKFTLAEAIAISRNVIEGLAALHKAGLAHGDLHYGNVIVQADGAAKIIDIDANKEVSLRKLSSHSRTGAISSDIEYCQGIVFKSLRHSDLSLGRLDDIEKPLQDARTLNELEQVLQTLPLA